MLAVALFSVSQRGVSEGMMSVLLILFDFLLLSRLNKIFAI